MTRFPQPKRLCDKGQAQQRNPCVVASTASRDETRIRYGENQPANWNGRKVGGGSGVEADWALIKMRNRIKMIKGKGDIIIVVRNPWRMAGCFI